MFSIQVSNPSPGGGASNALSFTISPPVTSCVSISPTTQSVLPSGGTGGTYVTAPSTCNWTASAGASWIVLTSAASGAGSGWVYFSFSDNTSTSSRSGTVTIGGQIFTLVQAGVTSSLATAFQPSLTVNLTPGFYIVEATLAGQAPGGFWGLEVLASKGQAAGGFNLGGALQAGAITPGFGAFLLSTPQTVTATLNAQTAGGVSLTVQFLDSNHQPLGSVVTGMPPLTLSQALQPGFYIVQVSNPAPVPFTYQLGLAANFFSGGVDTGGYVGPGITGFGAFYVPEQQDVTIKLYGRTTYGAAGAGDLILTLKDANRNVIQTISPPSSVSVQVAPQSPTLGPGQTQQFTATVTGTTNTAVTWSVNGVAGGNTALGTTSANGLYTAPAAVPSTNPVTVTATSAADPTKSASAAVTITSGASTVQVGISPSSATVTTGQTQQFTATVTGTTNTAVTWSVNGIAGGNPTVGTISATGLYTAPSAAPSPNTVTVKATSAADPTKSASATVTITTASASGVAVTISPTSASVGTGATRQFTATVTGTSNTSVTWSVNGIAGGNSTGGTISATGLYTAPAAVPTPSTVTITATSVADSSKSASASVSIAGRSSAAAVRVTPQWPTAAAGGSTQFTALALDASGTPLAVQPAFTWTSSASSVATISGNGLAQAKSPGLTTIQASTANVVSNAVVLTVTTDPQSLAFQSAVIGSAGGTLTLSNGSKIVVAPRVLTDGTSLGAAMALSPTSTSLDPGTTILGPTLILRLPAGGLSSPPSDFTTGIRFQMAQPSAGAAFHAFANSSSNGSGLVRLLVSTGGKEAEVFAAQPAPAQGLQVDSTAPASAISPPALNLPSTASQLYEVTPIAYEEPPLVTQLVDGLTGKPVSGSDLQNIPAGHKVIIEVPGWNLEPNANATAYQSTFGAMNASLQSSGAKILTLSYPQNHGNDDIAADLAIYINNLPPGVKVDLVMHSRGGQIGFDAILAGFGCGLAGVPPGQCNNAAFGDRINSVSCLACALEGIRPFDKLVAGSAPGWLLLDLGLTDPSAAGTTNTAGLDGWLNGFISGMLRLASAHPEFFPKVYLFVTDDRLDFLVPSTSSSAGNRLSSVPIPSQNKVALPLVGHVGVHDSPVVIGAVANVVSPKPTGGTGPLSPLQPATCPTLRVSPDSLNLPLSGTGQLTASVPGSTFSSSDPSVATVDSQGVVHAVGKGIAVITVSSSASSCQAQATVAVAPNVYKGTFTESVTGSTPNPGCTPHPLVATGNISPAPIQVLTAAPLESAGPVSAIFTLGPWTGTWTWPSYTCCCLVDGSTFTVPGNTETDSFPESSDPMTGTSDGTNLSFAMQDGPPMTGTVSNVSGNVVVRLNWSGSENIGGAVLSWTLSANLTKQ